ncbi:thioesterase family protein [Aneurinibacillus sp. Ricciae_BoGa-3]|uniref:acyl-CoA thioesterase n=1 Tax=Aneurinibacillus sp. Ricciae_BoGa-3 TaxID=3022697 RepID=UPI002341D9B0|nr:thioesterase family protein [Aneurinibacillus sp. Ricciae_BoGa-3]WCK53700.1 thioesterase family protein [Aneurinibacillus sp. Ricciae_BoGa-3]
MAKPTYIQPDMESWVKRFYFFMPINVRYCETDMSGHVNNISYFIYFEEGRINYFNNLPGGREQIFEEGSDLMIVAADVACHYLAEVFMEDKVKLGVRVASMGRSSLEFEYCLKLENRDVIATTGRGTIVLMSKATHKSVAIPEKLKKEIAVFEKLEMVK